MCCSSSQTLDAGPRSPRSASPRSIRSPPIRPGYVEEWTDGAGADIVFEVSGAAAAVRGATSLAKVRGTLVIVAIHPTPREIDLQRVFWRELRLLGARVYQRTDFEEAVRLLAGRSYPDGRRHHGHRRPRQDP